MFAKTARAWATTSSAADEPPLAVDGDDAAHEEQLPRLHGVREVGDRLGLAATLNSRRRT